MPSSPAACKPARSSSESRRPRQSTSAPPRRNSGAAYSSTTGCAATARASTTSWAPMPLGPLLHPRAHRFGVLDAGGVLHTLDERALARLALNELHLAAGQRDGERQPREAGARANVDHPAGFAHLLELERDQRVRKMHVNRLLRRTHGRRREVVQGQRAQDLRELVKLTLRQRIALAQSVQRRSRVGVRIHSGSRRAPQVFHVKCRRRLWRRRLPVLGATVSRETARSRPTPLRARAAQPWFAAPPSQNTSHAYGRDLGSDTIKPRRALPPDSAPVPRPRCGSRRRRARAGIRGRCAAPMRA